MTEESVGWSQQIRHILEFLGIIFVPFVGWIILQIINLSKQIILLEAKVNDSLDRRMMSIENKVQNLEYKLDKKIDSIEANLTDCKLSINSLITEKFENLMSIVAIGRKDDKQNH